MLYYSLALAAVGNNHRLARLAALGADGLNLLHNVHTIPDLAEHAVLTVQPRRGDRAEEELGSVGVRAGVGHGEHARAGVLVDEVLVRKLLAVDGFTSGSVAAGEVTSLAHKLGDHPVEGASLKVERLARFTHALLTGAEAPKVLRRLGDGVRVELHDDPTGGGAADGHVEEHLRVGHGEKSFLLDTKKRG